GPELFGLFELPDAVGIKWASLKQISGGPIASISIALPGQQLGTVVAIDITGHRDVATALYVAGVKALAKAGATDHKRIYIGTAGDVLELSDGGKKRPVGIVFHDDLLLIANPPDAINSILAAKQSLADTPAFESIRNRTAMKAGETANLFWY